MNAGDRTDTLIRGLVDFIRDIYGASEFIPLHAPRFAGAEEQRVAEVVRTGFVSSVGESVAEFEDRLARYIGSSYCVATVNGTAALHLALEVAGVCPGDEVVTQALTFVATSNAISYTGASPVFVDVDRHTAGMSVDGLDSLLADIAQSGRDGALRNRYTGRRLRACVPVHNIGHPVDIEGIRTVCDRYGLVLVEDAAESLGSYRGGRHSGTFGSLGIFSFNGNKIITTGGGGAVVTDDEELARRVRHLGSTAKRPHSYLYVHDEIGYNYRMPALNAALGCGQLEMLPRYLESKRWLAGQYADFFASRGYHFMGEPAGSRSNYWFNSFLTEDRDERDRVLEGTNKAGVMTRPAWTPMHTLAMYGNCFRQELPNTEWLEDRLVSVPSSVVLD